jgi:ADP-heptose:LPS heptosyltransferase
MLRLLAGDGYVQFVGPGEIGELLKGVGAVQEAVSFNSLPMQKLFAETDIRESSLAERLGRCERLISCFPASDVGAQTNLAKACAARRWDFLPIRPPESYANHLVDLWGELLEAPISAETMAAEVWRVPAAWQDAARVRLPATGAGRPMAVLHPGAGSVDKRWPIKAYGQLAAILSQTFDVVILAGPAESAAELRAGLGAAGAHATFLEALSLVELAGLYALCEIAVGNDSGLAHLAAAVGARVATVFRTTKSRHFSPLGPGAAILQSSVSEELTAKTVAGRVCDMRP